MTLITTLLFLELSAPSAEYYPVILMEEPLNNLEAIWWGVCKIESNHNSDVWIIDTNGKPSIGIAQIQQSRVDHFNRLTGKDYKHEDCFDAEISKEIFMFFARRIGNEEQLIKSWNGSGPMTEIYYRKVLRHL